MDLVVGSYVLSYPKTKEEAIAYCRAIASWLKPKGKFIGFNNNPYNVFTGERYGKYGFRKVMTGDTAGGEVVYWVDGMDNPITNYYAAVIYTLLDQPELAAQNVKTAVELGYPVAMIKADAQLDPLLDLSEYTEYLATIDQS